MNLISDSALRLREDRIKGYILYNSISIAFLKRQSYRGRE